jgi:GDP-D-mannose 3', 5'-epimerase
MNNSNKSVVVAGGGGFIGGHLVGDLIKQGYSSIKVIDIKPLKEWYQVFPEVRNVVADLKSLENTRSAVEGVDEVYNLAADMGGMGFIENNKALCMLSSLINTHLLMSSQEAKVGRYFYASSACVYSEDKQLSVDNPGLKESDAYPAMPEDGYGWEKLFSERMCRHFLEDYGITTRVARYHNVYGPDGTWEGGREKAPAAICRKVISAKISGSQEIEIWGDGEQTRSFMYIDDCIKGSQMLLHSKVEDPINIGSSQMVTINQLVTIVEEIAGIKVKRNYNLDAPKGVRGRSSDNALIEELFNWSPSISLELGMEKTYKWIYDQMTN